ncbi:MAG TPA: type II toxin-antitoxin system HicB family antitoxin [Gemmataceae bacterium]|nr:type II toxin-antitoxin system HicB family antitoxin [Gemmataceae bacterium]
MLRYAIVIEKATRNYSAYIPDVPGCVATGATVEEVQQNLQAALQLHLEGMAEDGERPPTPTSVVEYLEAEEPVLSKAG